MAWQDFEALVAEAYRRKGYRVTRRGGEGPDGGVDFELHTKDKRLVAQCKRWKVQAVGVQPIRELYGVMTAEGAQAAIFVTSGRYTPDAINFARNKPIELIDGPALVDVVRGVQSSSAAPAADPPTVSPRVVTTAEGPMHCPRCGEAMVRRIAKQGAKAGSAFWGCSRFPACRGVRSTWR